MHLGDVFGLRLRDGCPNWRVGKSWKIHGCGTVDPEHRCECDPEHPAESTLENWKSDEAKQAMKRFDAIEIKVFSKQRFTSQAPR